MCSQNLNTNLINLSQSEIYVAFDALRAHLKGISNCQVMIVGNFKSTLHNGFKSCSYQLELVSEIEIFFNQPYKNLDEDFKLAVKNRELTGLNAKGHFEPDRKIHTELIFLFGKRGRALLEEAAQHGYITFIYSKYIPCSGITTNINDCAVSLRDYVERHNKTHVSTKPLKFVVGYEDIFCFTIPSQSLLNLHGAGIPVIKLQSDPNQLKDDDNEDEGDAKDYLCILHYQTSAFLEILFRNLSAVSYVMLRCDGPPNTDIPFDPHASFKNLISFKARINLRYWDVVNALNDIEMPGTLYKKNLSILYKDFNNFKDYLDDFPLIIERLFNQQLLSENSWDSFQPYLQGLHYHLDICSQEIFEVIPEYTTKLCLNSFQEWGTQVIHQLSIDMCLENMEKLMEVLNYAYIQTALSLCEQQLIKIFATFNKNLLETKTETLKILAYILENVNKSRHSLNLYMIFSSVEPISQSRKAQKKRFIVAQYKDRNAIRPYLNDYLNNTLECLFQNLARLKTYTDKLES